MKDSLFRDWDNGNKYVKAPYQGASAKIGHLEYLYDYLKENALADWVLETEGYGVGEVVFDTDGLYRNTVEGNITQPSVNSPANGWVLIATNSITPTSDLITSTTTISSAEILDLGNTPVTLLPLPSAGTYYDISKITIKNNFNTTPYSTERVNITGAFTVITETALLGTNENAVSVITTPTAVTFDDAGTIYGEAKIFAPLTGLTVSTYSGANPTGGDGSLEVIVEYKIVTF